MTQYIELTQGKFAAVDDTDYAWLLQWDWFLHSQGYAVRNARKDDIGRRGIIYMHRFIIDAPTGKEVDHHDRNKLNNQRSNLREVTTTQNQHNRTPRAGHYKGVRFDPDRNKYRVRITVDRREIHLGRYATPEEAARVYDAAARQHFGEFARLNFPEGTR